MRPRWLRRFSSFVVVLLAVASPASAGEVSGKLILGAYKPVPAPTKRPPYQWELENGFKQVLADRIDARRELAVVLVGKGKPEGVDRVEVALRGGNLMPSTLVVRAGATVQIRNQDEIAHEIGAEGLDSFSHEAISPRGVRSVNLTTAGSWTLRDRLVVHVEAQLHVLPDLVAVAKVQSNGTFAFAEVPPGKYTLKVFHGALELHSGAVEVGDKTLTVDPITLTVPKQADKKAD